MNICMNIGGNIARESIVHNASLLSPHAHQTVVPGLSTSRDVKNTLAQSRFFDFSTYTHPL